MKTTLLSITCLSVALPLHAGWLIPPNAARISYSAEQDKGHATFDEALKELSASERIQNLEGINGFDLFSKGAFQNELFSGLERDAPKELKEALESSGNMHNPKMRQLWKPFQKTLLATRTITQINASLAEYGLTISRVGCEKFTLMAAPTDPKRRFFGNLYFDITSSSDKGDVAGIFDDPIQSFPNSFLPALSGFEKAKVETTLRGFYLRADTHPGFKQEHDPSDAGLYLNVAVRDPEEIPEFRDVSKPVGIITERTVEFPATDDEEVALRIVFTFGSKANPQTIKAVDKDIETLIHAWKNTGRQAQGLPEILLEEER